jgi:hypothetical protein
VDTGLQGKDLEGVRKVFQEQPDADKKKWLEDNKEYYASLLEEAKEKMMIEEYGELGIVGSYLKDLEKELEVKPSSSADIKETFRVASIDLGIKTETLRHHFDLKLFTEAIDELFKWTRLMSVREKYLAPYFALVQSSGMGKTKLMYEFERKSRDEESLCDARLLLCTDAGSYVKQSDVHEALSLSVASSQPTEEERAKARKDHLISQLEQIVNKSSKTSVVLLVDEAQHLVKGDGFLFRCFRQWLRKIRGEKKVVAVFAGTTSKLTNFIVERPSTTFSRDGQSKYHENEGRKLYSPFFHLSTCGAGKSDPSVTEDRSADETEERSSDETEFRRSVKYGRPLFHVMQKEDKLDDTALGAIQKRLLLSHATDELSWLSVLAVRVQMGQVSLDVASTLISLGYANLTHFEEVVPRTGHEDDDDNHAVVVQQCHFPDPVLARCAMQLMSEKPPDWTERAMKLFSTGMCLPSKGDTGEVFAALFMLLCGDELRLEKDENLEHFSVPLQKWLDKMGALCVFGKEDYTVDKFVSFIQVCRNYIRLDAGEISAKEKFLKELYESGSAIYLFAGAAACDLLVPIQKSAQGSRRQKRAHDEASSDSSKMPSLEQDTEAPDAMNVDGDTPDAMNIDGAPPHTPSPIDDEYFEGMLVSVKNRKELSLAEMGQCFASMTKQLLEANLENGSCLLLLLGRLQEETDNNPVDVAQIRSQMESHLSSRQTRSATSSKSKSQWQRLQKSSISCHLVIVDEKDRFGVGKAILCTTSPGGEHAEMYASHPSFAQLVEKGKEVRVLRSTLRKKPRETDADLTYTCNLAAALQSNSMNS